MTEHPPPPEHPGGHERPYDPQYAYPQYPVFPELSAPPAAVQLQSQSPRTNRTTGIASAVIATVGVVAVVLALVLLTDTNSDTRDDLALPIPSSTPAPPSAVAPDPGTSAPGALPSDGAQLQQALYATYTGIDYFSALQTQDSQGLAALLCRGTPVTHRGDLANITDATPTARAYVTGSQATMTGDVLLDDGTGYGLELTLSHTGGGQTATGWCVQREAKR